MATGDILNMLPEEVLPEKDVSTNIPSLNCQEINKRNDIISNENMPKRLTSSKKNKVLNFEDCIRGNKNSKIELEKSLLIQESLTGDILSNNDSISSEQEDRSKHSMDRDTMIEYHMNGFSSHNNSTLSQAKDNLNFPLIENGQLRKRKNIMIDKPEAKKCTSTVRLKKFCSFSNK